MTNFEQILLQEVATLPESRRADVLAFVRYLKLSIPSERLEIEKRFTEALEAIRARASELNITPDDIETEIRAVREANALGIVPRHPHPYRTQFHRSSAGLT